MAKRELSERQLAREICKALHESTPFHVYKAGGIKNSQLRRVTLDGEYNLVQVARKIGNLFAATEDANTQPKEVRTTDTGKECATEHVPIRNTGPATEASSEVMGLAVPHEPNEIEFLEGIAAYLQEPPCYPYSLPERTGIG